MLKPLALLPAVGRKGGTCRFIGAIPRGNPITTLSPLALSQNKSEMKLPWTDPRFRELVGLAVLAAFGCGLALSQGHVLSAIIFGAAFAVTNIEAIR